MKRRTIHATILAALLLAVAATQVLLVAFLARQYRSATLDSHRRLLSTTARLAEARLDAMLATADADALDAVSGEIDRDTGARVTVLLADGVVAADSRREAADLALHANRPEVIEALAGREGFARRFSVATQQHSLSAARPVIRDGAVVAVIRVEVPEPSLRSLWRPVLIRWLAANVCILAITFALAALVARRFRDPIAGMTAAIRSAGAGAEPGEWPSTSTTEIAQLRDALRATSTTMRERITTIEHLLEEQRAVFDGMVDGLLVLDADERVVDLNRAAAAMLAIDPAASKGRDLIEIARHARLATLVRSTLGSTKLVEGDFIVPGPPERSIQVHGTAFRFRSRRPGALMVLTDVTRLRKLETMRRDFVANASHELKTPVTAIRASAETLASDDLDGDSIRRFSQIVVRQANQLSALVEDLLELTRLEHDEERGAVERQECAIREIIDTAVETCAEEANEKSIRVTVHCPDEIVGRVNPPLLQRALVNLIDNAVKYSPAQTEITITCMNTDEGLILTVRDQGNGISAEHLDRIFERFYRVDKSRSRKLGGTGLGLSIVKHIARMHEGEIRVASTPGVGSAFSLHLPGSLS